MGPGFWIVHLSLLPSFTTAGMVTRSSVKLTQPSPSQPSSAASQWGQLAHRHQAGFIWSLIPLITRLILTSGLVPPIMA